MDDQNSMSQMDRLQQLPVRISARICRQSMTLDQFLAWVPGTVVLFDESALSPLAVCLGDNTVGAGQAVKSGSKMGLRIQRIGSTAQHDNSIEPSSVVS